MKYRIDSFGSDTVISRKILNPLTGDYMDKYYAFDYFATEGEFNEYLDMLIEYREGRGSVPDSFKKAFNE